MDQKRISRVLVAAGAVAMAAGIFLFFIYGPRMASECRTAYPELAGMFWPGLVWLEVIGLMYLAAMVEYFRIVLNIGRERSFIPENARGLSRIALWMSIAGCLWLLGIVLPWLIWQVRLGPAWVAMLLAAVASFAMGMLAWALGRLLTRAVQYKEENDLTV